MNKRVFVAAVTLSIVALPCSSALNSVSPKAGAENEVLATEQALIDAQLRNDGKAVGARLSDDWTLVGADAALYPKNDFLALFGEGTQIQIYTISDTRIRVFGQSASFVTEFHEKGRLHGTPYEACGRFSDLLVKRDGRWLVVSSHESHFPPK